MMSLMRCLGTNDGKSEKCTTQARAYMQCMRGKKGMGGHKGSRPQAIKYSIQRNRLRKSACKRKPN